MKKTALIVLNRFLGVVNTLLRPFYHLMSAVDFGKGYTGIKLGYKPRPDDIFVVTYPKSGTTWLQMIVYQLTTDGNIDFPHIATVSPQLEMPEPALISNVEDLPSPRIFKTHLRYTYIPHGPGKYIYVVRNGLDVAVSYYYHYRSVQRFQGSFDQFFTRFVAGKVAYGSWFKHIKSWLRQKHDLDVLFVYYEDLIDDLEGGIRRIANFLDLDILEDQYPRILERCSFAFMKKNEEKFDLAHKVMLNFSLKLNRFIRKGKSGGWEEHIKPDQFEEYKKTYEKYLTEAPFDRYKPGKPEP